MFGVCPASEMVEEEAGHQPEDLLPGAQNLYSRWLDTLSTRIAVLLEESGKRKEYLVYG